MTALPPDFLRLPLAHRALHDLSDGRPENSRAAIRAAIAHGYGIEIDVQLSADGQAMVFHDYALQRLTGEPGPIRLRSASALSKIQLLHSRGEGIPTLPEVLNLVAGQVPLLIEIKDQDGALSGDVGPLEQATATALSSYNGPVAVMSFYPEAVGCFAGFAPDIPRGLTTSSYVQSNWPLLPKSTCDRLRSIPDFHHLGASFISHEAADLNSPHVARLRKEGVPVLCWTIRSPADEATARRVADNITFEGYLADIPPA